MLALTAHYGARQNRRVTRRRPPARGLPLLGVLPAPEVLGEDAAWPFDVPAVAQVLREGLRFAPVTVLVGENGSGKSTLVEALAMAFGLNAEGGTVNSRHATADTESPLAKHLVLERTPGSARWGFFLRAETMHGWYTYTRGVGGDTDYHAMSHGESFLEVVREKFGSPGLYVLDEPESALSFSACLGLVGVMAELAASGTSQVVVATHSPVVASVPGALVLEVGPWGLRETTWEDLELVAHWRRFLDAPQRYLRHLA